MENNSKPIIIGTRGSRLALWQAHFLQEQLQSIGVQSELNIIKTRGDKIQHLSFDKIEGKGFFTKELEDALLNGNIDMAVHSMKDLPTTPPEGLVTTAVSYRENPADWMIIRKESVDASQTLQLKQGAVVGTSSARRKSQMRDFRPDITLKDIRGNVPTRIEKLLHQEFDAIILAAAGLVRLELNLDEMHVVRFNPKEFVPAPAQGVLAYQTKKDDLPTRRILQQLHHPDVAQLTNVERKVLQLFGGGCHMPLGVYCNKDAMNNYHVWAAMAPEWDAPLVRVQLSSSTTHNLAERIVTELKG